MTIHKDRAIHQVPMERFYSLHGMSRQGYFQGVEVLEVEQRMMVKITDMVDEYRTTIDRRAGSRSLYYNLDIRSEYGIGVNKFERLMSRYKLTLAPLRIRVVTTKSCLQSWNYQNLCNGLKINGINQLVVGDITYLSIGKYRYYLFCLTDVYSARVVGHEVSTRMRKEEAFAAYCEWKKLRGGLNLKQCIHHTDGGGQYFSKMYLDATGDAKIRMSVAKNCLENGYAEQKNGIIKNHLIPTISCTDEQGLRKAIKRILYIYNHQRKQEGLGWRSPVELEHWIKEMKSPPELTLHDQSKNKPSNKLDFRRHNTAEKNDKIGVPKKV